MWGNYYWKLHFSKFENLNLSICLTILILLWRHIWSQYRTDSHLQNSHLQTIHQTQCHLFPELQELMQGNGNANHSVFPSSRPQLNHIRQVRRLSGACCSQSLAEIPRPLATVALRRKPDTNTDRQSWHLFTLEAHQRNGLHSCIWCPATCWSRFVTQLTLYRYQKKKIYIAVSAVNIVCACCPKEVPGGWINHHAKMTSCCWQPKVLRN